MSVRTRTWVKGLGRLKPFSRLSPFGPAVAGLKDAVNFVEKKLIIFALG